MIPLLRIAGSYIRSSAGMIFVMIDAITEEYFSLSLQMRSL